jgi:hypothetical protein
LSIQELLKLSQHFDTSRAVFRNSRLQVEHQNYVNIDRSLSQTSARARSKSVIFRLKLACEPWLKLGLLGPFLGGQNEKHQIPTMA